jgi:hypothetical protein
MLTLAVCLYVLNTGYSYIINGLMFWCSVMEVLQPLYLEDVNLGLNCQGLNNLLLWPRIQVQTPAKEHTYMRFSLRNSASWRQLADLLRQKSIFCMQEWAIGLRLFPANCDVVNQCFLRLIIRLWKQPFIIDMCKDCHCFLRQCCFKGNYYFICCSFDVPLKYRRFMFRFCFTFVYPNKVKGKSIF